MRALVLLTGILLAGCGSVTPMEDLERQALLTGDWSAVEKRERMLDRQAIARREHCPSGTISYCVEEFGRSKCSCVGRSALRAALFQP